MSEAAEDGAAGARCARFQADASAIAEGFCSGKCFYFVQPARGARGFGQMRASLPSVIAESFCKGTQC